MSVQTINTIIIAVFAVIASLGFIRGYFKGLFKSLVDVIFTLIGLVASVLITKGISSLVITKDVCNNIINTAKGIITDSNVLEYLDMLQGYLENPNVTDTINVAVAIPTIILAPIIFVVVLFIVGLILKIPRLILEWLIFPKAKDFAVKASGGAVGAVRYSAALLFILVPVTGYLNFATSTIDTLCQMEENGDISVIEDISGSTVDEFKENEIVSTVYMIRDNPIVQMTYNLGGRPLFEALTTTNVCGVDLSLTKETVNGLKIYGEVNDFINTNPEDYGQIQIDALNNICQALDESDFIAILASRVIACASSELLDNGKLIYFEKPDFTDTFNPTVDTILQSLKSTNEVTIKQDIKMITDIATSTIKHGVLKELIPETRDVFKVLENEEYLNDIILELYENDRTRNALPYLSNSIHNYLVALYNEQNGTSLIPEEFNYDNYNKYALDDEAARVVTTIKKVRAFLDSVKEYSGDNQELACNADLKSFGEAVEIARDSVLLGRSISFFVDAFLHSEGCQELGIIDKQFIDKALEKDSNIAEMLVARQTLIKLTISMQHIGTDGDRHEMLESVIETMLDGDNAAIKELITVEYLESIGVSKDKTESINGLVNSVIDAAAEHSFTSEQEKQQEIAKTEEILNAISNSVADDASEYMFNENGEKGNSDMTAAELVEKVFDSSLVSSMVKYAVKDDEGNKKEDPYNIQENMAERDKEAITNAISDKYNGADITEDDKQTLEALATIFGVSVN